MDPRGATNCHAVSRHPQARFDQYGLEQPTCEVRGFLDGCVVPWQMRDLPSLSTLNFKGRLLALKSKFGKFLVQSYHMFMAIPERLPDVLIVGY